MASSGKTKDWNPRCLSQRQRSILIKLAKVIGPLQFYLGGGTAVALYLGHRRSVDLDWFCPRDFGDPLLLAQRLRELEIPTEILSLDRGTLHANVTGIRVSFLVYNYPLLKPPNFEKEFSCNIASLDDLGCMKLSAAAQRGSKKDFIDIYALVERHKPLLGMFNDFKKKYSTDNLAHVLYGLAYFDDADLEKTPTLLWKTDWRKIKNRLREELKIVTQRLEDGNDMPDS